MEKVYESVGYYSPFRRRAYKKLEEWKEFDNRNLADLMFIKSREKFISDSEVLIVSNNLKAAINEKRLFYSYLARR